VFDVGLKGAQHSVAQAATIPQPPLDCVL
jgi:hypothetical protein